MRVLCTGGAGYLGSVLVPRLLREGFQVILLDDFRYGLGPVPALIGHERLEVVRADAGAGEALEASIARSDALVPLACLTGAPLCALRPVEAVRVNLDAVRQAVSVARVKGARIVYPMTNSGYGASGAVPQPETAPLRPLSVYGRTKAQAEAAVLEAGGVSLRFATLYGPSARMRWDLLVNDFCFRAVRDGALIVRQPLAMRNVLHVEEAAEAVIFALGERLDPGAYNVAERNLTKMELADAVAQAVPGFHWQEAAAGDPDPDGRDAAVDTEKLAQHGFRPCQRLQPTLAVLAALARLWPAGPDRNA